MPPKPFANDPNLSLTAATSWSTSLARRFATNPPQGTPIYFLDTGAALLGPTPSKPLSDADLNHYNSSVRRPILAQRREPGNFSTWQARSHVNVRVGEWPSATAEERTWYEERLQTDQTIWEATGIHEAIALSFSLPSHTDRAPIAAMACLWNSATNTFDFPFGQMGITLLDILAITGLPIHAKPYVPGDFASTEFTYACNLGARRALRISYGAWRKFYMGHAEPHEGGIAFLEYWLDKFVFCGSAHKPTGRWTKLAEALYNGVEVGLGQPVLGALYRTLHLLSLRPFHLSGGPLWILDLWTQLYFPLFRRAPVEFLPEDQLLGFAVCRNAANRSPLSFFASLSILYNHIEPPPTMDMMVRRRHPEVLSTGFFPRQESDNDARTAFVRATSCCDLQLAEDEQGFELYAPNHFARQLGFHQGIPYPLLHSVNKYTSWRKIGESDRVTPLQNIYPLSPNLLEIEPSLGTDPAYLAWWRSLSDNHWEFPDDAVFAAVFRPLYDTLGESDRTILDGQRDHAERSSGAATRTRLAPPPVPTARRPTGIVIRERDPTPSVCH